MKEELFILSNLDCQELASEKTICEDENIDRHCTSEKTMCEDENIDRHCKSDFIVCHTNDAIIDPYQNDLQLLENSSLVPTPTSTTCVSPSSYRRNQNECTFFAKNNDYPSKRSENNNDPEDDDDDDDDDEDQITSAIFDMTIVPTVGVTTTNHKVPGTIYTKPLMYKDIYRNKNDSQISSTGVSATNHPTTTPLRTATSTGIDNSRFSCNSSISDKTSGYHVKEASPFLLTSTTPTTSATGPIVSPEQFQKYYGPRFRILPPPPSRLSADTCCNIDVIATTTHNNMNINKNEQWWDLSSIHRPLVRYSNSSSGSSNSSNGKNMNHNEVNKTRTTKGMMIDPMFVAYYTNQIQELVFDFELMRRMSSSTTTTKPRNNTNSEINGMIMKSYHDIQSYWFRNVSSIVARNDNNDDDEIANNRSNTTSKQANLATKNHDGCNNNNGILQMRLRTLYENVIAKLERLLIQQKQCHRVSIVDRQNKDSSSKIIHNNKPSSSASCTTIVVQQQQTQQDREQQRITQSHDTVGACTCTTATTATTATSSSMKNHHHHHPSPTNKMTKKMFVKYMTNWLRNNWTNPYNDDEGIQFMAHECQTTIDVIINWLINARTRKWRPALVQAIEYNRPALYLYEDSLNIFDKKPIRILSTDVLLSYGYIIQTIDHDDSKMSVIDPTTGKHVYNSNNDNLTNNRRRLRRLHTPIATTTSTATSTTPRKKNTSEIRNDHDDKRRPYNKPQSVKRKSDDGVADDTTGSSKTVYPPLKRTKLHKK